MRGTRNPINATTVRVALRFWISQTHWTMEELTRCQRAVNQTHTASAEHLQRFISGPGVTLSRDQLMALEKFMRDHPNPPSAKEFRDRITAGVIAKLEADRTSILARRIANEKRRADHVRRHLAQEHQPKRIDRGVLFGLDRATVAALSGVTA